MAQISDSTKTGGQASQDALDHKEGTDVKPTVDSVADKSAKQAGERMKKNEAREGIFTK